MTTSNQINVDEEIFDALRLSQPADLPPVVLLPVDGGPDPRTNLTDEVDLSPTLSTECVHLFSYESDFFSVFDSQCFVLFPLFPFP